MCATCALAHSVLQSGIRKSTTRCSSATAKFLPFSRVERLKPTDTNNLEQAFELDSSPQKINLCGEIYRGNNGKPHVFQAVRKAEIGVAGDDTYTNESQPPLGNPDFIRAANELALNKAAPALLQNRVSLIS